MKLEIDIPSILYQDAKENGNYISVTKLEIAWKAIADGKPLEQEPTTKNDLADDCISRKRAIERLELNFPVSAGADNSKERYRYMQALADVQAIRELPPVTPQEPRKGYWISRWYAGHNLHFHVCSECNEEFSCDMETGISIDNYRYCPNCGCRMDEPQESEG